MMEERGDVQRPESGNGGTGHYAVDFTGWDGLHGHPPIRRNQPMSEDTTLSTASGGPLGEISQAPPALEVFLDRHQMKLIVLAVLLALFAIAYVVYEGVETSKQETAGEQLVKAEDISGLQEVVKNNSGTAASESARILLAEKQWEDGQQDDAIETLQTFVGGEAGHPARPSALASLATKLLAQGKTAEAEEIFNEITTDPDASYIAPYAWISLGDIHMAKGDKEAAAKAYETVGKEYPESPFKQEAAQRGLLLKASPPVEVEAKISVPDVSLTGEDDGSVPDAVQSGDLLDAIGGGAANPDLTPLLPVEENGE